MKWRAGKEEMSLKKRILAAVLAGAMLLPGTGCAGKEEPTPTPTPSQTVETPVPSPEAVYTPGTYQGSGYGCMGTIQVEVTLSESAITGIQLLRQRESPVLFEAAWDGVTGDVLAHQSLDVDVVSGATLSSRGIAAAVEEAIALSGADMGALRALRTREDRTPVQEELSADVVVIGAGGAGLAAALSAREQGASVIVLEKAAFVGGNTAVSDGYYNAPDPETQAKTEMSAEARAAIEAALAQRPENAEHRSAIAAVRAEYEAWKAAGSVGTFDSPAWFALQTWTAGGQLAEKAQVDLLAVSAYDGLQWLRSLGVEFSEEVIQSSGSLYPRTHAPRSGGGENYVRACMAALSGAGEECRILLNTKAEKFLLDGAAVVGVQAVDVHGSTYTIRANRGVVLATGGFAGNTALRQRYCQNEQWPDLGLSVLTTNLKSVTGDGVLMAGEIGAAFLDLDQLQLFPMGNPFTGAKTGALSEKTGSVEGMIFVNASGERFVAEDGSTEEVCAAILQQSGGSYWLIHDSANMDPYSDEVEELLKGGYLYRANTLTELCGIIGIAPENLQAAVDEYNAACAGEAPDPLGRTHLSQSLGQGPWFAARKVVSAHHTMGGVRINENAQALYPDGSPVPGLYAAGEVTCGTHGGEWVEGNALADAVVFGRIAGKSAAKN